MDNAGTHKTPLLHLDDGNNDDEQPYIPKPSMVNEKYKITPMSPIDEVESLNALQDKNTKTPLDDLLDRIGFGRYQIFVYLIVGFILVNDGAEVIVLSFLFPILERDPNWLLTNQQTETLSSCVFAGFLIGSLLSGRISDKYGRRKPLIIVVLLLYLFAMLSAAVSRYQELVFVRTCFGFLVGLQFPMCFALLTEVTPPKVRGKMLVLAGGFFTIGEIMACFIALFCLDSITAGNWRALFIWVAQPAVLCGVLLYYYVRESPRYDILIAKNIDQGIKTLEFMAEVNEYRSETPNGGRSHTPAFSSREINTLKQWGKETAYSEESVGNVRTLLDVEYKRISINIWVTWFVLSLVYYGIVYILPLTLAAIGADDHQESKRGIYESLVSICAELPSMAVGYFLIENKTYGGRKKSMILMLVGGGISCGLIVLFSEIGVVFFVSIARFLIDTAFIIATPYTSELYPTSIRSTGIGFASAASRIGGVFMPWISVSLFGIHPLAPFAGFAVFCFLAAYSCKLLPYDTTDIALDATGSAIANLVSQSPNQREMDLYSGSSGNSPLK